MDESKRKIETDWFFNNFSEGESARAQLESFNEGLLCSLKGEERKRAEDYLIDRLESFINDPRVPNALEAMECLRAVPALKKAAEQLDETAVASSLALWKLIKYNRTIDALLNVVENSYIDAAVIMAINVLGKFNDKRITETLVKRLSKSNEANYTLINVLIKKYKLEKYEKNLFGKLNLITTLCLNPLTAFRKPAIKELLWIFESIKNGKTPESLGLEKGNAGQLESSEYRKFWNSLFEESGEPKITPIDIESFNKLNEKEKEFAKALLFNRIAEQDVRTINAVAELKIIEALAALKELVKISDEIQIKKELKKAITRLEKLKKGKRFLKK